MRALSSLVAGRLQRGGPLRRTSRLLGPALAVLALASLAVQAQHLLQHRAGSATALLTLAIVFGAALVSSVVGFAFSALAGAGLLHLYERPAEAVEIMVLCSIAIQLYCVLAMRRAIQWRRLPPFLVGGALCVPLGVWLLSALPCRWFAVGLGAFLTGYGAFMLWRGQSRVYAGSWWVDLCIGALGGITGGLAAFPGAFVTVWCSMRGWDKSVQRAVTQPFILAMQLVTLVAMHAQHVALHLDPLRIEGMLVALFAAFLGMKMFRALSSRQFAYVLNGLLMVSGVLMILHAP
ncbi:MAG TPA: sulfite exporter TauE/SafE family protein [Caldimonas sp.]